VLGVSDTYRLQKQCGGGDTLLVAERISVVAELCCCGWRRCGGGATPWRGSLLALHILALGLVLTSRR
jgi:hypothetical protein